MADDMRSSISVWRAWTGLLKASRTWIVGWEGVGEDCVGEEESFAFETFVS